ncbi:hypothetical protein [Treponema endosymbiont of Eucomonympha sp.]|uniref:hypothetical protein n=1 Tax=Treponema endosymbiont of Eucomonympha sp. TaxID=1580831 RepID=UPI000780DF67|nr:hypothetical protein [Treponema endosymbiont of Eucomonympha sp.]
MPIFAEKNVLSREKRCSALSAYQGTIRSLLDEFVAAEGQQNIRTFTQANPDDILAALSLLCTIRDAVVVAHGAIGCGAACLGLCRENSSTWYSTARSCGIELLNSTTLCGMYNRNYPFDLRNSLQGSVKSTA